MEERQDDSQQSVSNPERVNRRSRSARRVRFATPLEEFYVDDSSHEVVVPQVVQEQERHCHDLTSKKSMDYSYPRRKTMIAISICVVFMLVEGFGGYLSGSLAITANACRLLGYFFGLLASLFSLYIVEDPSTKSLNFGSARAEIIGALASVVAIWTVSATLICLSITRCILWDVQIDSNIMMITSAIGLLENFIMGTILHQNERHQWDNDPENAVRLVDSIESSLGTTCKFNINTEAAIRHVFKDVLYSLGVFTTAVVIYIKPQWAYADLICTIIFSCVIIYSSLGLTKKILNVLMEGVPEGINYENVHRALLEMENVLAIHNLRMWSLSMTNTAVSVHLAIQHGSNVNNIILREASNLLKCGFGFYEVAIQIEEFRTAMVTCKKCREFDELEI
ncbi:unnamed protein product [Orchesella dallaii]|uniref:Zinc transporter 2 n=1 Tax=Orchesella dallaii TaxID=48710 RepID=A0ABP1PVP3_9HEXA